MEVWDAASRPREWQCRACACPGVRRVPFRQFRPHAFSSRSGKTRAVKNGGRSTCLVDLSSRSLALPGHPSTIVHYQERKRSSVFAAPPALERFESEEAGEQHDGGADVGVHAIHKDSDRYKVVNFVEGRVCNSSVVAAAMGVAGAGVEVPELAERGAPADSGTEGSDGLLSEQGDDGRGPARWHPSAPRSPSRLWDTHRHRVRLGPEGGPGRRRPAASPFQATPLPSFITRNEKGRPCFCPLRR